MQRALHPSAPSPEMKAAEEAEKGDKPEKKTEKAGSGPGSSSGKSKWAEPNCREPKDSGLRRRDYCFGGIAGLGCVKNPS